MHREGRGARRARRDDEGIAALFRGVQHEFLVIPKQKSNAAATSDRSELNVAERDAGSLHRVEHVDDFIGLERLAEVEALHLVADLRAQEFELLFGIVLPRRATRVQHAIDYLGAGLLALALIALVLFTDLGGIALPWSSAPMLALGAGALLLLLAFVQAERRAAEPVLPLGLFANRTFALTAAIGLIVGFAMFGTVTYIPLFLQVVNGVSPTGSGLQLLPMMGGMLATSITSAN